MFNIVEEIAAVVNDFLKMIRDPRSEINNTAPNPESRILKDDILPLIQQ